MSFPESNYAGDLTNTAQRLAGWLPIRVKWNFEKPFFDWCYFGARRFIEPFFDDTVERELSHPFNLLVRPLTGVDILEKCSEIRPGLKPSGFIFHLSRCGSTLISQMLAALPQNVVISEASPLDWMIRAKLRAPTISDDEKIKWIQWMVSALGQKRSSEAEYYFIKFDSWNTFDLDILTRAFPDTPWIFLYRHPLEVMVSHDKQRGGGTIPGIIEHRLPGLTLADSLIIPAEEYVGRVLAAICKAALRFRVHPSALFVNYNQLPLFAVTELLRHFQVEYTEEDIEIMKSAARFNAKAPADEFVSDTRQKQNEASRLIRKITDQMLMPLYAQLEAARLNAN